MGKNEMLILNGYGLDIRLNSNGLLIKNGFPNQEKTFISAANNDLDHIVVLGQSGSISIDAIHWLRAQNIAITFLDSYGNIATHFIPWEHKALSMKRRQASLPEDDQLEMANYILQKKIKGQYLNLQYIIKAYDDFDWWDSARQERIDSALGILMKKQEMIAEYSTIDGKRIQESHAALSYWQSIEGIPIKWQKSNNVPQHWLTINCRTSPKSGSPRFAVDPFNAVLNYLYTVAATSIGQACNCYHIDADFGIIHADHEVRSSLVYDIIEPVRPIIDRNVFDYFMNNLFKKKDFMETREGYCKVSQTMISEIIPLLKTIQIDIYQETQNIAAMLKNKNLTVEKPKRGRPSVSTDKPTKQPLCKNPLTQPKHFMGRKCLWCGKEFDTNRSNQDYCCEDHQRKAGRKKSREKQKTIAKLQAI